MKTFYIPYLYNTIDAHLPLVKELYHLALENDPLFHFFFEPTGLIIRTSTDESLHKVQEFLAASNIAFEQYSYPYPPATSKFNKPTYGENADSAFGEVPELLLSIYHAHAVAAILLNDKNHAEYRERIIHTAYNPRGVNEGEELIRMGLGRLVMEKKLDESRARELYRTILESL